MLDTYYSDMGEFVHTNFQYRKDNSLLNNLLGTMGHGVYYYGYFNAGFYNVCRLVD